MNYEERLQDLLDELDLFQDWTERYEYIISLGKKLPKLDEAHKTEDSLIKGCQSRVWLYTEPDKGVLKLYAGQRLPHHQGPHCRLHPAALRPSPGRNPESGHVQAGQDPA